MTVLTGTSTKEQVTAASINTPSLARIGALSEIEQALASNLPSLPLAATTQGGTAAAPTSTTLWRFNAPAGDTHGPFAAVVGGAFFIDTFDRVLYWGYNGSDGGGNIVGTEPKLTLQIENDFNDGTGHRIEFYWEYAKASGASGPTTYRPWFVQIDRANGNVLSYQLNATTGFSFNTTDGAATTWGNLSRNTFTTTPASGNNTWAIGWVAGGQNSFSIGNGTLGFLLQPVSAGNQPWQIQIGSVTSIGLTTAGIQAGDPNVSNNGVLQATPSTAFKDSKYNLYLQAQAAQSIQLLLARASDGITNLFYANVDGTWHFLLPPRFDAGDAVSQSATAPAVASSGTIATASLGVTRVAPTGNVTAVILAAGTIPGQRVTVVNESAFTITFDVAATSNVADGATSAIPANSSRFFVWDSITARWYRSA